MKISYLVTCSTETDTLKNLLECLTSKLDKSKSEIVIVQDDTNPISTSSRTWLILNPYLKTQTHNPIEEYGEFVKYWTHPLNNDYGSHKNFGNSKCSGDWIFQMDGDELPPDYLLGDNLESIIESNPEMELIFVPRQNDFKGVTDNHAKQWNWKLSKLTSDGPILVNWPDYQGRIYKNVSDRIRWDRKLHERIEGHKKYSFLPAESDYALYHDKTIEKQIETNLRYNKQFSEEDNRGHVIK
jgi:glycosyltransferase involved in cell wall biosynthesis